MRLLHKLSILVVDDEPTVRNFVMQVLQRRGYTLRSAGDGEEAANLIRENPGSIGLLLTDLDMPRKNGVALIQEAKLMKPDLPVIAMSGAYQEWRQDGISLLAKPFSVSALLELVEKHFTPILPSAPAF